MRMMKAIMYDPRPLGWATVQWLKHLWPGCRTTRLNGFALREIPVPELPGRDWVLVRTRLGGICGSDTALAAQKQPPDSLLQAYTSMPMVLGHENVATVELVGPGVDGEWRGKRVVVEPTLGCRARGTEPMCDRCRAGEFGACENFSGDLGGEAGLPPGVSIGYNARTGGSWGEYFVAHESQLIPVDDSLSDTQAVLIDPLAVSVHGVLRANLLRAQRVLVYGVGIVGLGVVGALRALGFAGRIEALGRGDHLADRCRRLGADEYFTLPDDPRSRHGQIAGRTGATLQRARFGNFLVSGGYDVVFDCVGSDKSFEECSKWTRARGQVVMLGTLQRAKVDLTPLWFRELEIIGAYGRQWEAYQGRRVHTYQLTQELIVSGRLKVEGLVTHRYEPEQYRKALDVAMHKSAHKAVKVAFDFPRGGV